MLQIQTTVTGSWPQKLTIPIFLQKHMCFHFRRQSCQFCAIQFKLSLAFCTFTECVDAMLMTLNSWKATEFELSLWLAGVSPIKTFGSSIGNRDKSFVVLELDLVDAVTTTFPPELSTWRLALRSQFRLLFHYRYTAFQTLSGLSPVLIRTGIK